MNHRETINSNPDFMDQLDLLALSDEELMQAFQAGNRGAFVVLVKRHTDKFYNLAYRMVFNKIEAEDITQEAFLKLFDQPHKWDKNQATQFTTWFYRVVINICKDHQKKKKPMQLADGFDIHDGKNLEELLERKEQKRYVDQCLLELPENQRIAICLCFYEGLSNQEAADIMGLKLKALQSLLMRAKVSLKQKAEIYSRIEELGI